MRYALRMQWAWAVLACPLAALAAERGAPPVLTLLEGGATMVRGVARHTLAEGVHLKSGDILDVGDKAIAEMEFADQAALTLGPQTRILAMQLAEGAPARGEFYLPEGVVKVGRVAAGARLRILTPYATVQPAERAAVVRVSNAGLQVFAEGGPVTITARTRRAEPLRLRTGEFFSGKTVQRGALRPRPTPEFIAALPRLFLDPLPSRLARVKGRPTLPRELGTVDYDAVEIWLKGPYTVRRPMPARFRALAENPKFRDALIANLRSHPEWDRILFPEKYEPKEPARPEGTR